MSGSGHVRKTGGPLAMNASRIVVRALLGSCVALVIGGQVASKSDDVSGVGLDEILEYAADGRYAERSELPKCPDDQNQRYDGCFGTYAAPNGDKYVGEWKDDLSNGNGIYTFANGEMYVGEFKDGKSHGQGTHTWPNGDMYIGEWKDDEPSGSGISRFADGDKYVGEYKNGEFHGQGAYTFADGEKYVGEFEDGERHGQGIRYSPDGTALEEGYWENGQRAGDI